MEIDDEPNKAAVTTPSKSKSKSKSGNEEDEEEDGVNMMALAQSIHKLSTPDVGLSPTETQNLSDLILLELKNPSLYRSAFGPSSTVDLASLEASNEKRVQELKDAIETAKEEAGDMEVLEASLEYAKFAFESLSKDEALEAYAKVLELPKLSSGKKIDVLMKRARVASFYGDTKLMTELVDSATKLANDWDRRNRLKVYDAMGKVLMRDIKGAASLLVDCIATFSCTEFCNFNEFVVYSIVTNILHLPRTEIKEKIIDGPEIVAIVGEIPEAWKLVNCLYDCDYKGYLNAMVDLQKVLIGDRYFYPHCGYIMRELLVLGYKQFLDAYKSVTLESMASSFGVSVDFLDAQLSRFIAAGRLTAKIDKFEGIVETNRPDLKNAQYRDMIQKGDNLLNRVQKLARVVDL